MNEQTKNESPASLKRVLGFSSLLVVALGGVCSQSSFVSILNGAGTGGGSFFIAILIAFLLTLCYVFTWLELSLMMPKAGGLGTYTATAMGPFLSIAIVLGGYIAIIPFAGPAEVLLLERVVQSAFPSFVPHLGIVLLVLLTVLNLLGMDVSSSAQNILVYTLFVTLFVIGLYGLNSGTAKGETPHVIAQQIVHPTQNIYSIVVLALWAFMGLEFICPLIEEAKNPEKNVPRAMIIGAVLLLIVFTLIAFAGMRQVEPSVLSSSEIPHWLLVQSLFGNAGKIIIVTFAITASSCITSTILASVPRMLYGMANAQELPAVFKKIHPRFNTPWVGILFVSVMIIIPLLALANVKNFIFLMLISAASLWLIAYIVAHIDVMILRKKYPNFKRPFKTPWYPLPQIIGIAGMVFAIADNSPSPDIANQVYLNAGLITFSILLYSFLWVKFKMKKGLFETKSLE